jgi:hypothetical protein
MLRFHYTGADKPDNVTPPEKDSGIFWQTKFDSTRVGHGGSDPGVQTEMLANLTKDIGVSCSQTRHCPARTLAT